MWLVGSCPRAGGFEPGLEVAGSTFTRHLLLHPHEPRARDGTTARRHGETEPWEKLGPTPKQQDHESKELCHTHTHTHTPWAVLPQPGGPGGFSSQRRSEHARPSPRQVEVGHLRFVVKPPGLSPNGPRIQREGVALKTGETKKKCVESQRKAQG